MSQPRWIPEPVPAAVPRTGAGGIAAVAAAFAVAAGTAVLGVALGFAWVALAPRPWLVMTGTQAAAVINPETSAFIVADAIFAGLCLAGGVVSGVAGFLLAVRRWGPLPMAGVLAGAVAAAFLARWVGEQSGLAVFHHLLMTLPVGARLQAPLALGADSAIAFWPLAAGVTAAALTAMTQRELAGVPLSGIS